MDESQELPEYHRGPHQWNVYEYLKQTFMRTGTAPTIADVIREFKDVELEEIEEGIREFNLTVGRNIERGMTKCGSSQ